MFDKEKIDKIEKHKKEWEEECVSPEVRIFPERKEEFTTMSGIPIKRVYTPKDIEGFDYMKDLSFPGEYPFTRGIHSTMYRGRFWTIRQFTGFGDPRETNKRLKYLLEHGTTGLNLAFDLPTINGLGSDHPLSEGEVGRDGVPVDSLEDVEELFDGIPLDKVSTSLVIAYPPIPCMYIITAEKQGVAPHKLAGTYQNDSFCRDVAANVRVIPRKAELKLATDLVVWSTRHMPRWYPISIVGYQIREKGCTAAQEIAFTLSEGIAFVESFLSRGLGVDEFGPRLSFMWNAHNDFFEEIAKYRAARRIWARIMKERFGAKDPRSMMVRFHTQTAGCSLTAQQPEINIARVAIQALAAVLGGTQSLHTNSMDEALALPTEDAVRIAVRTQQVIAEESGVTNAVDPLGGSYFVEALTNRVEEEALAYIEKINSLGGMMEAVETGYVQREVAKAAYRYQKEVESGETAVVGVNKYITDEEQKIEILEIDEAFRRYQCDKIERLKERRDNKEVKEALEKLRECAERDENLMEPTFKAARAYATLHEIWDVYRDRYGTFDESAMVTSLGY